MLLLPRLKHLSGYVRSLFKLTQKRLSLLSRNDSPFLFRKLDELISCPVALHWQKQFNCGNKILAVSVNQFNYSTTGKEANLKYTCTKDSCGT